MARQKAPSIVQPIIGDAPASPSNTTLVANHHSGPLLFPRKGAQGVSPPPLVLNPGRVTPVDFDEWEDRKKNHVVQHWLDKGILSEVSSMLGQIPIMDQTSTDLDAIIPENLKPETHSGDIGSAGVKINAVGEANL